MWKIIFSDIDGTLLDKERKLSKETLQAYNNIKEKADLVLISSRMPKAMVYFQDKLRNKHTPLVCYNGGLVLKNSIDTYLNQRNILLDISIPSAIVQFISKYLLNFDVNFSVYSYDNWYSTKDDYWTKREENNTRAKATIIEPSYFSTNAVNAHKIMIMGDKEAIDQIYAYLEENYSISLYRSKDTYIEIASKETSKGKAVELLLNNLYPYIAKTETIAFGDNYNDIPLFEAVGDAVAVENARIELKDISTYTTETNKNHGVAIFLNRFYVD